MAQTKLITGANQEKRAKQVKKILKENGFQGFKPHPDLFIIEGLNSIGIDQVRELKKKLTLKPYSAQLKIAFITEAEKLTLVAQNALLKTLEEPPGHSLIILSCLQADLLLPTIVSRCRIINLGQKVNVETNKEQINQSQKIIEVINKKGVGERLILANDYLSSRQEAIDFTQNLLLALRKLMRQKPSPAITGQIRQTQKTLTMLEANINPKLCLDNLLLGL